MKSAPPNLLKKGLCVTAGLIIVAFVVTLYDARTGKIRGDFTEYSLAASSVLYKGGNPYSNEEVGRNYKYFPINALLIGPLTLLPIPLAQGIFYAINVGLLLWCFREHRAAAAPAKVPWWVWAIALIISLRYIHANLKLGQWNTSVYCLAFIGWSLARRRPWLGGGFIGLAAALKFLPGLLMFYYLARRQWREATAIVVSLLAWIFLVPTVVLGPSRNVELLTAYRGKTPEHYANMRGEHFVCGYSLNATLYGYLTPAIREGGPKTKTEFNLLHLDPRSAGVIVDSLMALFLIGAMVLSGYVGRRLNNYSEESCSLIALMEIGLWFMIFLAIPVEVRRAHLISTFTPSFALALGLASKRVSRNAKTLILVSLILSLVLMLISSSIIGGTVYNDIVCVYGSFTFSYLALGIGCLIFLLKRKEFLKAGSCQTGHTVEC
jgi:alpha-1,2-mannosyltransferase